MPSRTTVAGREAEPVDQHLLGDQPGQAVARREGVGEAAAAGEHDARRRAGSASSTALTWTRVRSARRRAADGGSERKSTISETAAAFASIQARSAGVGEAVGELDLGVAAEQRRGLAGEAGSIAARTEPTAAIAATPSARQARKTRKPASPPRSSRRARRSGGAAAAPSAVTEAESSVVFSAGAGRSLGGLGEALEPAVAQPDHPVAAGGELGRVGDEHQRRAVPVAQAEEQPDDRLAGGAVEVAGRLVGEQDRRPRRPRRGRAPPAAARRPRAAPDSGRAAAPRPIAVELGRRRGRRRRGSPASSSGVATFSIAVIVGIRWKDWKTTPMWSRRKRASASSPIAVRSWPSTVTRPAVAASSPPISIRSDDLPEPDGPTRPSGLAAARPRG